MGFHAKVAQLVEHTPEKRGVASSILALGTLPFKNTMNTTFLLKKWTKQKISSLVRYYLGSSASSILVKQSTGEFLVPISDLSFVRSLHLSQGYNKPLLNFIKNLLSPEDAVLFVGTHIGTLLIPTAKICRSVTGIEANPDTFRILERNLILNHITNGSILNVAAFDKKTTLSFRATKDNTGGSKVAFQGTNSSLFRLDEHDLVQVPGERLDDVIPHQPFKLMVMDIEGSEVKALLGMDALLKRIDKIIIEILPLSIEQVAQISPTDFFNAIPHYFNRAIPINEPAIKNSYTRNEFLNLYADISNLGERVGVDVLFEKS